MKETIDVPTGRVKADCRGVILKSKAIGSCVAVVAYDAIKKIGAIAHIMLPGTAPGNKKNSEKTKYSANAIEEITHQMTRLGSEIENVVVVIVGGGNVLNRKDDTICKDNIKSTLEILKKKHLKVMAKAVGGISRRSISLDIEHGIINYTEGDGSEKQLWTI